MTDITHEIILLKPKNALDIFKPDNIDKILGIIRAEALAEISDSTTPVGRKIIISRAAQISKTKVHLDNLGKQLVSQWKEKSKAVDQDRKKARDTLDALRDEIRLPVTEWENIEKSRISTIKSNIEEIRAWARPVNCVTGEPLTSHELKNQVAILEVITIDRSFAEFEAEAHQTKKNALMQLEAAIIIKTAQEKKEAEERKLEEQRQLERQVKHDEEIARAAAKSAREDEREKIRAELLAADLRKRDADRKEAEEIKHAQEIKNTAAHKAKCNPTAAHTPYTQGEQMALAKLAIANQGARFCANQGLRGALAKEIMKAILAGKIPYVSFTYQ